MERKVVPYLLLMFVLPLVLGGCGGGAAVEEATTTTSTTSTTIAAEAAATTTTTTTTSSTTTTTLLPGVLSPSGGAGQVVLSWGAVDGAQSYNLYWGTSDGVTKSNGTKISGVTSPYTHSGRSDVTTYYYILTAVDAAGNEGAASAQASAATTDTTVPTFNGVTSATANSSGRVTLSWTAATDNSTAANSIRYSIYQGTSSINNFSTADYLVTGETSKVITGLTAGTTYYFVVRAKDSSNNAETNTTERSVATNAVLSAPVFVKPLDDDLTLDTTPTLDWADVTNAATYEVQIDNNSNFSSPTATGNPTTSTYTIPAALDSGTYYWRVRTSDGDNYGSWTTFSRRLVVGKTAGDVNGDGYADVIVGASDVAAGGSLRGQAYIYYGGADMNTVADVTISGGTNDGQLGASVASAGDVNGDGYSDVIVGAAGIHRAYIYYGGAPMDNSADKTLSGSGWLGCSVSSAGDVNSDGYSDVIVGAYGITSGGKAQCGAAYLYCGGADMDTDADVTFTGAVAGDNMGISVAGAGDVNNDGYADVMVGAPANDTGGDGAGQVTVYCGGAAMDATADLTINGSAASLGIGFVNGISSAGDVNGDGYTDIVIGDYANDTGGTNRGQACIYYGGAAMDTTADKTLSGIGDEDYLGHSVASAGDVNNDGYSDVLVGADMAEGGGTTRGSVYIYYGAAAMDTTADYTLNGTADSDQFGMSISSVGDVNQDGYADVIGGAPYNASRGANAGEAKLYYGGAAAENTADKTFTGAAGGDKLGYSVGGGK